MQQFKCEMIEKKKKHWRNKKTKEKSHEKCWPIHTKNAKHKRILP